MSLDPDDLEAIAALERRVVAADGGRLKLEWGSLRTRSGERMDDLLCFDGHHLVGFAGLYAHGGPLEISGMVDPAHRRRGLGSDLLAAALGEARRRGAEQVLLVCPRTASGAAAAFATARGGRFEHAEHALVLTGEPADGPSRADVTLRPITEVDVPVVEDVLAAGFGVRIPTSAGTDRSGRTHQIVIEHAGQVAGFIRLTLSDGDGDVHGDVYGDVHGFVIAEHLRGQGIGRDVLRRCCRRLRAEGATRVGLEVATDNERALGLYTSLGFAPVITEDYYAF